MISASFVTHTAGSACNHRRPDKPNSTGIPFGSLCWIDSHTESIIPSSSVSSSREFFFVWLNVFEIEASMPGLHEVVPGQMTCWPGRHSSSSSFSKPAEFFLVICKYLNTDRKNNLLSSYKQYKATIRSYYLALLWKLISLLGIIILRTVPFWVWLL